MGNGQGSTRAGFQYHRHDPIAVFAITEAITKEDLKKWLGRALAGSRRLCLGLALQDTGLAKNLIGSIPFAEWSPFPLMVGTGIICLFMPPS